MTTIRTKNDADRSNSASAAMYKQNREILSENSAESSVMAFRQPIITYCNGNAAFCQGDLVQKEQRIWRKAWMCRPKATGGSVLGISTFII
ncbi:MAG: hypothetical protein IJ507_00380 [Clostridia bacterium]|nr:hypothetical protein [Clostridia bacterium]